MPSLTETEAPAPEPAKLVLCFDGTGNTFSGSTADTNVVKLLSKLDRNHPRQYHYYQTGIGTYDINESTVNKSWLGEIRSSVSQVIDQGFATTFDAHVMAGYRFLMRYYESGAKIYVFGFSRGAFTAKFLARMINKVGLLCKGNEEMVPFAYLLYQRYLAGEIQDLQNAHRKQVDNDNEGEGEPPVQIEDGDIEIPDIDLEVGQSHETEVALNEIAAFSQTFCRRETATHRGETQEANIKVYFLGIWDCVSSVAVLERKTPIPVPVAGTAHYVRHAVAVDERRVKFKAALLAQDIRATSDQDEEDIREVWFPGNHGDVGGGWPSEANDPLDDKKDMTFWQSLKNLFTSRKPSEASKDINAERMQMSDVPLAWMIRELELVGQEDPAAAVKWCENVKTFKTRFQQKKKYALESVKHDTLSFGAGCSFFKVLLWKFLEYIPFITRWELTQNGSLWVDVRFPLNKGAARDIPRDAVLHESVILRLRNDDSYLPTNNHGDDLPPCLKYKGCVPKFRKLESEGQSDPEHPTYQIVPEDE